MQGLDVIKSLRHQLSVRSTLQRHCLDSSDDGGFGLLVLGTERLLSGRDSIGVTLSSGCSGLLGA